MRNVQEFNNFLTEVQASGLRDLTEEQQKMLDDHDVRLSVIMNTEQDFYLIIPSEEILIKQINDESLSNITAAKSDCVGTTGTGGTAGTLSSFPFSVFSASTASCLGTASTASSGHSEEVTAKRLRARVVEDLTKNIPQLD